MRLLLTQHAILFEAGDFENPISTPHPVPVRARWLFQILVALAAEHMRGNPWVPLERLAELEACRAKLSSAGTKLATYRTHHIGPLAVSSLIIPFEGVQRRGPYALGIQPTATISPDLSALETYLASHSKTNTPNKPSSASSQTDPSTSPPASRTPVLQALRWIFGRAPCPETRFCHCDTRLVAEPLGAETLSVDERAEVALVAWVQQRIVAALRSDPSLDVVVDALANDRTGDFSND